MRQGSLFQNVSLPVSDVTRYIRQVFESDEVLQDIWISGEISNLARPSSGHIYFTLKDATAAMRCVIWRSAAARLRAALQNGMAVEAHGSVSIYERDGTYQLYVDQLRAAGAGLLYQEFIRLRDKLAAEGLFDEERKRPIPQQPAVIGIVTSPTGAALHDMLNTIASRYPLARVALAASAVQGDEAPPAIVRAINLLNQTLRPDVILLARGGGSLEDLWAFNDERVIRAIAASRAPIITGVGHETDFTLADFTADLRAPTPTGAAVAATPDKQELKAYLFTLQNQIADNFQSILYNRQMGLDRLAARLERSSPHGHIQASRQYIDDLSQRMQRGFRTLIQLRQAHIQSFSGQLLSLNPKAVLLRGYAVVSKQDGKRVVSVNEVDRGQRIQVRLHDGSFDSSVDEIHKA